MLWLGVRGSEVLKIPKNFLGGEKKQYTEMQLLTLWFIFLSPLKPGHYNNIH
jgi:hypothetical protein